QHGDQTLQVETPVLAVEADAGQFYRQVALAHQRHVSLAVNAELDAEAIVLFAISVQLPAGVTERPGEPHFGAILLGRERKLPRRGVCGPLLSGQAPAAESFGGNPLRERLA